MSDHVFGIDLGTTYSAIAYMNDYNQPEVIRNREGDETTPSVVFFESESTYVVGKEAKHGALVHRDQTVSLIKRQMGTHTKTEYFGQPFFPETISAIILKDLTEYAREATGLDVTDVIVTVPAYFGLVEKEATRQAGQIAGLNVKGIIAEPVAAALSAGMKGDVSKTLLVYDLGGGTFDCTVMRLSPSGVDVLVTDGNRLLGGADWDLQLFDLVAEKFRARAGLEEDPTSDEDFAQYLRNEVEACKMTLSRKQKSSIKCSFGTALEMIEVSRDEFEARTGYLVNETLDIVERAMASAQAKSPDIAYDEVLLVGGACRMPMIEAALKARFGWSAVTKTEFDLAVAKGAAIYGQGSSFAEPEPAPVPGPSGGDDAAQKTFFVPGSDERKTISGVLPKGIGIKLVRDTPMGGSPEEYVGFLAHAQASLPDEFPMMVHTYSANTTVLTIHVFEQGGGRESELLEDNREITPETGATFVDLPSLPKGSPIDVNLRIDAEGLGTLSAVEPQSGQKLTLRVKLAVMQAEEQGEATRIVDGMVRGN